MSARPKPIPYYLMEQIRRGIIAGRYPPGGPLREQMLEQEFGVSRGPIREALRLLELRGLATHEPRRGFRVREYSAETVTQIYGLRALLERRSVEALAGRPLEGLVDKLRAANARMADRYTAGDIEAYLAENVSFHDLILAGTGNEPLQRAIAVLNEMAQPIRFAFLSRDPTKSHAVAEHAHIIALIEDGDIAAAAAAMEAHVMRNVSAVARLFG